MEGHVIWRRGKRGKFPEKHCEVRVKTKLERSEMKSRSVVYIETRVTSSQTPG